MSTFMEHIHRDENPALAALRHHVSGAVERGEAEPIVAVEAHTWANGFGVWHARVPNTPHRHEMTAYQAIRAELQERAPRDTEIPAFGLKVVEETDTTITYREDWPDDHTDH